VVSGRSTSRNGQTISWDSIEMGRRCTPHAARSQLVAPSSRVDSLTLPRYVDWRVGAEFFEMHLIDYDTCSNWGNWQYQGGSSRGATIRYNDRTFARRGVHGDGRAVSRTRTRTRTVLIGTAGVGNDPRSSRQFNPIKQANDYDPHGEYVRTWLPELKDVPAELVHIPWRESGLALHRPRPFILPPDSGLAHHPQRGRYAC
jgi:hypothetical protein